MFAKNKKSYVKEEIPVIDLSISTRKKVCPKLMKESQISLFPLQVTKKSFVKDWRSVQELTKTSLPKTKEMQIEN